MVTALDPPSISGPLNAVDDAPTRLADATAYAAADAGATLTWAFEPGTLTADAWLVFDALVSSDIVPVFELRLRGGRQRGAFIVRYGLLPHAQARVRLPLSATDLRAWLLGREGAWLKPCASGHPIDPAKATELSLEVIRWVPRPVRWEQSPIHVWHETPPTLSDPQLPRGRLLDELGQATWLNWPGRTADADAVTARLVQQHEAAADARWPQQFNRWGGDADGSEHEATGFFRAEKADGRWRLIDPDGRRFWSAGCDCVRPGIETAAGGLTAALTSRPGGEGDRHDFLAANLRRAFGDDAWKRAWDRLAAAQLRGVGFNTIGNWSDTAMARAAGFPHVMPLHFHARTSPDVFRGLPDVFDPAFEADAEAFARQLEPVREEPSLIGYFLMNEPQWGFAEITPAEGMLINTEAAASRDALVKWLRERYADDAALKAVWGRGAEFEAVARGRWKPNDFTKAARADLAAFSTVLCERFFGTLTRACRAVDPHHLNLGARYHIIPPDWALAGMKGFDCFSFNCYAETIPHDQLAAVSRQLDAPVMVGEWHFGALDAGLSATGIGSVHTQADRGRAYRRYLEDAAADPHCVGVHWFTLYDQSALGRFDGEPYQIGFLDVCHRPYAELAAAARESHERMYDIAAGRTQPTDDRPAYPPRLFI